MKENMKNLVLFFAKAAAGVLFLINPEELTVGFIIVLGVALTVFGVFNF